MIGSRLTVVRLGHDDQVYYEWSDLFEPGKNLNPYPGEKPYPPVTFAKPLRPGLSGAAAATVRIEDSGRLTADFDPRDRSHPRFVVGELSEEGFSLAGYEARLWLPRLRDLGAKIPVCDFPPPKRPK